MSLNTHHNTADRAKPAEDQAPKTEAGRISSRTAAWVAWSVVGLSVTFMPFRWLLFFLTPPMPYREVPLTLFVLSEVLALTFPVVGAFVASRRPRNPIGWILCGMGLLNIFGSFAVV